MLQVKLNKSKHSELIAVLMMKVSLSPSFFSVVLCRYVAAVLFVEFGEMENCKIPSRRYCRHKLCIIYRFKGS